MVDLPEYVAKAKIADLRAKVLTGADVTREELREVIDLVRLSRTAAVAPATRGTRKAPTKPLTLDDF